MMKDETVKQAFAIALLSVSLTSVAYAQPAAQSTQSAQSGKADQSGKSKQSAKTGGNIVVDGKPIAIDQSYAKQLMTFRKLGVPLCFPTFVPARFVLSSVKLDAEEDKQHPDYKMEFRDKNNHCLAIESAYTGIGDGPDGDRQLKGSSKVFGAFRIDVFKPGSEGNCTKQIYYLSSWLSNKKMVGAEKQDIQTKDARYYHFLGEGVTDQEAIEIVQSLQPVSDIR